MAKKTYAYVGNWHFKPRSLGVTLFNYNEESGDLSYVENFFPNAAIGQTRGIDRENGILYMNNEGRTASIISAKINPNDGRLTLLNEVTHNATWPSWFCLDKSKKYGLVSAMGEFESMATLTVYQLENDGSITAPTDWTVPHKGSKLHCVVPSPNYDIFVVIDRESARIYSYKLNRENGKLKLMYEVECERGSRPRYCAFHPTLPIFYTNNEGNMVASAWKYDAVTGAFEKIEECRLLFEDVQASLHHVQPSDILVDEEAKNLYVTVRGVEKISVIALDEDGKMSLKQNIETDGHDPRGFCIAPDGRYAFTQNQFSHDITKYARHEDGTLEKISVIPGVSPGNMVFYQVDV